MILAGVKEAHILGEDIEQKSNTMGDCTFKAFEDLCKSKGFMVSLEAGDVIGIPAGHLLVTYAPDRAEHVELLRWSIYDKEDQATVLENLQSLITVYPRLQSSDYNVLAEHLRASAPSAA